MEAVALKQNYSSRIHPQKFALWTAFASIMMMFGAFTSAYIVRQAAGNWLEFPLPNIFYLSTAIILISSVTLHLSYRGFIAGSEARYKSLLVVTFFLAIGFMISQYVGWQTLFASGVDMKGNPAGSFLYVITGVHALHILGGIGALIVAMIHAFGLKYKVTDKRKIRFELVLHYWHFVDLLWVYLLIFLLITR